MTQKHWSTLARSGRAGAASKITSRRKPSAMALLRQLYIQVLIGILLAVVLGIAAPSVAVAMKPLGDAFIALLRMMLAPIIFCSIVHGLTHISSMSQLGRLGLKSLVYFEVLTTIAMAVGFIAVNV